MKITESPVFSGFRHFFAALVFYAALLAAAALFFAPKAVWAAEGGRSLSWRRFAGAGRAHQQTGGESAAQEKPSGMILYAGPSLHGDSTERRFKSRSFSSFLMGFQQQIGTAPILEDIYLKTEIQNFHLQKGRATQINITGAFSRPGWEKAFPVYVGAGAGFGFYPFHILKGKPFLSLNTQFFTGLRLLNLHENLGLNFELSLHLHYPLRERELYMDVFIGLGAFFNL